MHTAATLVSLLSNYFSRLDDVILAYLFGSYGRSQARIDSDVDIAVLLADQTNTNDYFDKGLIITGDVTSLLQHNAVDVVILNQAPLALSYRVVQDGILFYCRNRDRQIEFTARTVNAYLDFEPIIIRHEQAILERARKGELLHGYNPHRGTLERYRQLRQRLKGITEAKL